MTYRTEYIEVPTTTALPLPANSFNVLANVTSQEAFYKVALVLAVPTWVRLPFGSSIWTTQGTWFIDATLGDNNNRGDTALVPIAAHSELEARMQNQKFQQATDISINGALASTDPVNIRYGTTDGVDVRYLQTAADTILATTTINSATAIVRTLGSAAAQTINTVLALGAFIPGKIVRTAGAGTWSVAWLAADLGGNNYRISPGAALPTIPTPAPVVSTPVAGDSIDVRSSPTIFLGVVDNASLATVTFNRFTIDFGFFTAVVGADFINFQECAQATGGAGPFYNQPTVTTWIASLNRGQSIVNASGITLRSGLSFGGTTNTIGLGSQLTLSGDQLMQGNAVTGTDGAKVVINNAASFGAATAYTSQRDGTLRIVAGSYGAATGTGYIFDTGGHGWYATAAGVATTGTTQDLRIGTFTLSLTAVPQPIPWSDTEPRRSQSYLAIAGNANFTRVSAAIQVAAYTASFWEVVRVDPTAGAFPVTLPTLTAGNSSDVEVTVKNVSASANAVTITAAGGQTIDGVATFVAAAGGFAITLRSDSTGTNWMVL